MRGFNRGPISDLYQGGSWVSVLVAIELAGGVCSVSIHVSPATQCLAGEGTFLRPQEEMVRGSLSRPNHDQRAVLGGQSDSESWKQDCETFIRPRTTEHGCSIGRTEFDMRPFAVKLSRCTDDVMQASRSSCLTEITAVYGLSL